LAGDCSRLGQSPSEEARLAGQIERFGSEPNRPLAFIRGQRASVGAAQDPRGRDGLARARQTQACSRGVGPGLGWAVAGSNRPVLNPQVLGPSPGPGRAGG
jgi:hypothetical protein